MFFEPTIIKDVSRKIYLKIVYTLLDIFEIFYFLFFIINLYFKLITK